jgi:hypothetical protein
MTIKKKKTHYNFYTYTGDTETFIPTTSKIHVIAFGARGGYGNLEGGVPGKGGMVSAAFDGLGIVGIMQAANAQFPGKPGTPGLFPTISGYEENPIMGLGEEIMEEESIEGYEENPTIGNDASGNFIDSE